MLMLEMAIVMMRQIYRHATMMVVTVVGLALLQNIVQIVIVLVD